MKKIIFFSMLLMPLYSHAQYRAQKKPDAAAAKDNFSMGNFRAALEEYRLLHKAEPANLKYAFHLAVCMMETNTDREPLIPLLQAAMKDASYQKEAYLLLAKAYLLNHRYDDASRIIKDIRAGEANLPKEKAMELERLEANCTSGKELFSRPLNVQFENLGKEVNTEFADYYPFVDQEEKLLAFTSRRKGVTGSTESYDGYYSSDIFFSQEKNGKWTRCKNAGPSLNSDGDDEAVGVNADGSEIYIYSENEIDYGDILYSQRKGKTYQKRTIYDASLNSADIEAGATTFNNGNTIIFSSNRPGGKGGLDLYIANRLPNGQWGTAINLGETINTPFNEDFPIISPDGRTLYFASEGHYNMGGFDIFKCSYNAEMKKWGSPVNLGYPVNTAENNMTISYAGDGKHAYISALRPGGMGDLDIYRITFATVEERNSAVRGTIKREVKTDNTSYRTFDLYSNGQQVKPFPQGFKPPAPWVFKETKKLPVKEGFEMKLLLTFQRDTLIKTFDEFNLPQEGAWVFKDVRILERAVSEKAPVVKTAATAAPAVQYVPVQAEVVLREKKTGNIIGSYQSMPATGKYVMIVPPGVYEMEVIIDEKTVARESVTVLDKGSFQEEVEHNIILK